MLFTHLLTTKNQEFCPITAIVAADVTKAGVQEGMVVVYCPHTTASITVNENADDDVKRDLLRGLTTAFPEDPAFLHMEGNSTAHLKSGTFGVSQTFIIHQGRLVLGCWQDIYFAEFDGPRERRFYVKVQADN